MPKPESPSGPTATDPAALTRQIPHEVHDMRFYIVLASGVTLCIPFDSSLEAIKHAWTQGYEGAWRVVCQD